MTNFEKHVAAARLYPATTQKAAIASARALGVTIRREAADAGEARGFDVYVTGSPESAMYAECIREALFLAEAIAADVEANRLSMFGPRPTLRGMAEAIAARAAAASGLAIGDCVGRIVQTYGCPVVVFSGPWGVEYRMELREGEPMAEHATRAAAAAEAAADEIAAHAAEAGGSHHVSAMVAAVATQREAEAAELAAHAGPAPTLESMVAAGLSGPLAALRYHVTGAIERGEGEAVESIDAPEPRQPRSLSAAANPDAPARLPRRRRMARNRAELAAELAAAEREHGPDSVAAELARSGLSVASGGFPLYAFRDGSAYDADSLDSLAYGASLAGLR